MKTAALIVALGLVGCVDSGTGTGGDSGDTGASSTDPSGSWNALQYTYTSKADASQTTDLVIAGDKVSMLVTVGGDLTITITLPTSTVTVKGSLAVVGNALTLKAGTADTLATGTFNRNGNQMTMDLSGKGFVWDMNHDGATDLVSLHTVMVAVAH